MKSERQVQSPLRDKRTFHINMKAITFLAILKELFGYLLLKVIVVKTPCQPFVEDHDSNDRMRNGQSYDSPTLNYIGFIYYGNDNLFLFTYWARCKSSLTKEEGTFSKQFCNNSNSTKNEKNNKSRRSQNDVIL